MSNLKKISVFIVFIVTTLPIFAQDFPPLPELKFAEIVKKDMFQGDRWSYMESGSQNAETIICTHGIGGNSMDFRYQLHELSKQYRVVAWNAPGYMLSDQLKAENPNCKDYADAMADFLDALNLKKVYIMGNSFGTRVATCFALHYPERVIKMVYVGPSAAVYKPTPEERAKYMAFREGQIPTGGISFANNRAKALVAPNTSPALLEVVQNAMKATNKKGFLQTARYIMSEGYSPEEIGAQIKTPTLIIVGLEDKVSPLEKNGERYKKYMPNARLEIFKDIGHLPHLEMPDKVNKMTLDFFKEK